jgi:hypothetical protein
VLLILLCAAGDAHSDPAPVGNPYSFYGSVAECAAAERSRCDDCLAHHTCAPITDIRDGEAECTQLADHDGRGYFLICINLALAIDAISACTARGSPCPRDAHAGESLSSLEANAPFFDDPVCAAPLDTCLAALYGAPAGGFPGSGSDPAPPPRNTSVDCGDSCSGDTSCDSQPGCEIDPSCEASDDTSCSGSGDSSGCDDASGGDAGGDSCSGDSEDACGSEDNSSCDSSDCGGGGDSDCSSSSGGGGDCGGEGGGGDCGGGGGGGDCGGGGGGGDCGGGGGGDCNVAAKRGRIGTSLPVTIAWAMLPIPIAVLVRRRAQRRRAETGRPS